MDKAKSKVFVAMQLPDGATTVNPVVASFKSYASERDSGLDASSFVPSDTGNFAYAIMLYLGLANLFPWNAFITAAVYFGTRFCDTPYANSFESYFSFCGTTFQTLGLALSVVYQERFTLHSRIVYPLLVYSLIFSVTTVLVLVPGFNGAPLFWLTSFCVTLTGLCGAVLSGGLFSMSAVFPPSYTAALMSGQALAGMVVSVSDLLTSWAGRQPEGFCGDAAATTSVCHYTINVAAFAYFLIATLILLFAALLVYVLMKLPFTVHHMRRADWEWRSSGLSDRIHSTALTTSVNEPLLGGMATAPALLAGAASSSSLAHRNSLHSSAAASGSSSSNDLETSVASAVSFHSSKLRRSPSLERLDSELQASVEKGGISFSTILRVLRVVSVPAFAACFNFIVTLSIFPALTVFLRSEHKCEDDVRLYNDLYVPFYFLLFNTGDFLGRVVAGWVQVFRGSNVWIPAVLRIVFIPLFLFCNNTGSQLPVVFRGDVYPILFMVLFAFSSGYTASSAMMLGPTLAQHSDKNLAGAIMIFCLTLGLMGGSVLSFAVVDISQGRISR